MTKLENSVSKKIHVHDYFGYNSKIICISCGQEAPCEKKTHRDMYGYHPYPVKTHRFMNGVCVRCGLYQKIIGKYKPLKAVII